MCGVRIALLRELKGSTEVVATESLGSLLAQFQVRPSLVSKIVNKQIKDVNL